MPTTSQKLWSSRTFKDLLNYLNSDQFFNAVERPTAVRTVLPGQDQHLVVYLQLLRSQETARTNAAVTP